MDRSAVTLAVLLVATLGTVPATRAANIGSQRVGTSALTFLKIGVGARPAAMGQSVIALPGDPEALFHNPAGLADIKRRAVVFERVSWLTGIDVTAVGLAAPVPWGGVAGASLMGLGVEMEETTELAPSGTGRSFSHRDLAAGLSYARHLTDRFSLGLSARLIYEALGTEIGGPSGVTWVMDMGTTFHTGFRNVVLAVAIQSFGADLDPGGGFVDSRPGEGTAVEYSSYSPPTTFRLGTAYQLWAVPRAELNVTGEFVRPADNDETLRFGTELEMVGGRLMLRGGYDGASDALPWSGGFGVAWWNDQIDLALDYAFSHSEYFDRVDRVSLKLSF
ncbi:MAG: PorV/PorQ family protein [Candidatus Eiseniibacteriota bacterium]|jgi:hypothetical protein